MPLSAKLFLIVRRHNWRQFSLRGLLVFTVICGIGSLIWSWTRPDIRYRQMRERQQMAAAVERLGGSMTNSGNVIDLTGQIINNSDVQFLASLPAATDISGVVLNGTGVTDEVVAYLNLFPRVNYISMNGCLAITDEALKDMEGNRRLQGVHAVGTQATDAGVERLLRANHSLRVYWGYHKSSSITEKGWIDEKEPYTDEAAAF